MIDAKLSLLRKELKLWRESEPEAPEGPWYKDYASFRICGDGKYAKSFLLRGPAASTILPNAPSERLFPSFRFWLFS